VAVRRSPIGLFERRGKARKIDWERRGTGRFEIGLMLIQLLQRWPVS
jgi:hypothetical protein